MSIKKFFFLLTIVRIAVFATAQTLPPPQPLTTDCWQSLEVIPDCVPEIFRSITNGQFGNVGPSCCRAFSGLNADCIPQMFIFAPLFPPSRRLKDHCSRH
ncbi:hypothetical protein V5N11_009716 [Cardamine amara subsp. amara]|uniref:Prolamin-like domain-containing protein n=1 Tax=Cardamine amara subsp. amara TaxID=228776 RepID=A0ABD1BQV6_CARAN